MPSNTLLNLFSSITRQHVASSPLLRDDISTDTRGELLQGLRDCLQQRL